MSGGKKPERQTAGAIGYDVHLRALVSPWEMDPENPRLRRTLFDFGNEPSDPKIKEKIESDRGELIYRLDPGHQVLGGIGFATEMPFPIFFLLAPRSGLASKHGINITNAPGTVDPDYRGEAGVVIRNMHPTESFFLRHQMRIAQIIFLPALIPDLVEVGNYCELRTSVRGVGGFGSTGV